MEAALPGITTHLLNLYIVDSVELPDDIQHTKERFHKKSAHLDSIGLGLSTVKKICDVYGYELNYSNQKD